MNRRSWYLLTLFNLAMVALLGFSLRSKIIFPISWIDHKNFINAHSHFAFGAWASLSLLCLFAFRFLPVDFIRKGWYKTMFWGVQISATGMLLSFPFQGYGVISIIFSTLFILFTYGYTWLFVTDIRRQKSRGPEINLALASLGCLVISSAGPFLLAYIIANGSANAILYKDAIYFYLHFQYNGFFTLAVFALLASRMPKSKELDRFSKALIISIIPSFFLSLLWHSGNIVVRVMAFAGVISLGLCLFRFYSLLPLHPARSGFYTRLGKILCRLMMISFIIKTVLQAGTVIPSLGHAVFGLRPIIIGFLHLVFLGLVSFYILAEYREQNLLRSNFSRFALVVFMITVIVQETVLLVQGLGLLRGTASPAFNWMLWAMSILLFLSALGMCLSGNKRGSTRPVM